MNRTLALALLTGITTAGTVGLAGTAGAADPICDTMHAAADVTFLIGDGVVNVTATARPGCEGTQFGVAGYATAHLTFDPTEVQPLLAHTSVETVLGPVPVTVAFTVPTSTITGQCRVQIDSYVGAPLPEINPTSRYNELAVGVDSNGDGQIANRLIAAGYVDKPCAPVVSTPDTTPSTVPPHVDTVTPPPIEVVSTPTPAPEPPAPSTTVAAPVELIPPVVELTSTAMLPVTGRNTGGVVAAGMALIAAGFTTLTAARRVSR